MKITPDELFKIAENVLKEVEDNVNIEFFEDEKRKESGVVTPIKGGFLVSIPDWILSMGKAYATWYIIHECTHCLKPNVKHNKEFKELEKAFCLRYGIKLEYGKLYPRALYDLDDNLICTT